MPKTKRSPRSRPQSLQTGQVWRMAGARLKVGQMGKSLVFYKLGKPEAVRIPNSVASKDTVAKYLKKHKAVLMRMKRA